MWQENSGVIQIELGEAVIDLTARKYQRSLFDKFMDKKKPEPAQLLLENIKALRGYLQQEENIYLPTINVRDAEYLDSQAARIYFGIEIAQFKVHQIDDIINPLLKKSRSYFAAYAEAKQLDAILAASATDASNGDYFGAFQKICYVFYFSALEDKALERNIALGYGGNYALRNGDYAHAHSYIAAALNGINSSSIFPAEIRASLSLDAGNILRIWGDISTDRQFAVKLYNFSAQNFQQCIEVARTCGDSVRLYFGLCGLAGIAYIFNDFDRTDVLISNARNLLADNDERKELTEFLLLVKTQRNNRLLAENAHLRVVIAELEKELKTKRFINQVGKFLIQLVIAPGINAVLSGMGFLGQNIKIANSRFDGPAQIGFKNYSQMLKI